MGRKGRKYETRFEEEDFASITVTLPLKMLGELKRLGAERLLRKEGHTVSALLREGAVLLLSAENQGSSDSIGPTH